MIGIVVVSHSRPLAEAAVVLAQQMSGPDGPLVRVAAGASDGGLGTDATAIAAAIEEVATDEGVLVLMDLGSALLSAETALEFVVTDAPVALSPGPFVEGLVSAVVAAAGGATLEAVLAESVGALEAKRAQLGDAPAGVDERASGAASAADEISFEAVVRNPSGLHARPAAAFARAAGRYDATVRLADLDSVCPAVAGDSLIAIMALGIRSGTRVRVSATGPQAGAAVNELRAMIEDGFGEF